MKNNNFFKFFIRLWIGIASLIAFLGGWIILGHSGKPVSASAATTVDNTAAQLAPLPTLAPLPSLDSSSTDATTIQQIQPQQSFTFNMPRFRTRGS
ncbi:MAG TPA: hypothetical protein VF806_06355 [Anaerolineaceae bacterium]